MTAQCDNFSRKYLPFFVNASRVTFLLDQFNSRKCSQGHISGSNTNMYCGIDKKEQDTSCRSLGMGGL